MFQVPIFLLYLFLFGLGLFYEKLSMYFLLAVVDRIYTLSSAVMSLNTWVTILSYEDADHDIASILSFEGTRLFVILILFIIIDSYLLNVLLVCTLERGLVGSWPKDFSHFLTTY